MGKKVNFSNSHLETNKKSLPPISPIKDKSEHLKNNQTPKHENYMTLYKNQDLLPVDLNLNNLIKKNYDKIMTDQKYTTSRNWSKKSEEPKSFFTIVKIENPSYNNKNQSLNFKIKRSPKNEKLMPIKRTLKIKKSLDPK